MKLKLLLFLILLTAQTGFTGAFGSGRTACPASGNVALTTTNVKFAWGVLLAPSGNTGVLYIGDSTVSSTTGAYLNSGDSLNLPPLSNTYAFNTNDIFFACSNSADSIQYVYLK